MNTQNQKDEGQNCCCGGKRAAPVAAAKHQVHEHRGQRHGVHGALGGETREAACCGTGSSVVPVEQVIGNN